MESWGRMKQENGRIQHRWWLLCETCWEPAWKPRDWAREKEEVDRAGVEWRLFQGRL
jgi:hypothetical protein